VGGLLLPARQLLREGIVFGGVCPSARVCLHLPAENLENYTDQKLM